jgi:hypothetical protein
MNESIAIRLASQWSWIKSLDVLFDMPDTAAVVIPVNQWKALRTLVLGTPEQRSTLTVQQYDSTLPTRDNGRDRKYRWRSWLCHTWTWYHLLTSNDAVGTLDEHLAIGWWSIVDAQLRRDESNHQVFNSFSNPCLPVARLLRLVGAFNVSLEPLCLALCLMLREQIAGRLSRALEQPRAIYRRTQYAAALVLPRRAVFAVLEHLLSDHVGSDQLAAITSGGWRQMLTQHRTLELLLVKNQLDAHTSGQDFASTVTASLRVVVRERVALQNAVQRCMVDARVACADELFQERRDKAGAVFRLRPHTEAQLAKFTAKWDKKHVSHRRESALLRTDREAVATSFLLECDASSQITSDHQTSFQHRVRPVQVDPIRRVPGSMSPSESARERKKPECDAEDSEDELLASVSESVDDSEDQIQDVAELESDAANEVDHSEYVDDDWRSPSEIDEDEYIVEHQAVPAHAMRNSKRQKVSDS